MKTLRVLANIIAAIADLIIIGLAIVICTAAMQPYKVTMKDANEIFNKMTANLDPQLSKIELRYDPSPAVNAYAHKQELAGLAHYYVTINKGMLDFVESTDELAVVIGHEVAHHLLGHTARNPFEVITDRYEASHYHELMADRFAVWLNKLSGNDYCTGADLWIRMAKSVDSDYISVDTTHPAINKRVNNYRLVCNLPPLSDAEILGNTKTVNK